MMGAIKIDIRDAEAHLSRFIQIVKNGGEVVLTDRGKPVGIIVQYEKKELSLPERIEYLEGKGIIAPEIGKKKSRLFTSIPVPDNAAQKFLRGDRDAGR